ncbi:nicotinate-nucleotide--dimethylbenzimidazole phosphoribosyltransferase [Streptomyces sp. FB2]|uniref:nicotinate-nucleotide--dimethylbenzimidazole phosphoribosyltransferase n=1 Tax=Streptomyces sp. FB2 TaxID=2902454 RepID=UPI001F411467|nr:nicotinate-nucleotide--dimethylbenzimidazole phosphoribosyltransferase [Streptomyces sp. FB2]MCF2536534.1 nicotinate-nucleotide--dimethylbenzimidazole phosphoribosyltransferase [Streptomyces sp. FB2]
MTDTGQVPGEGLPESAGMVEQPGVPAAPDAYSYLSETPAEEEDLLLPGSQGAWGNEVAPPAPEPVVEAVHEPDAHELSGRDSGSVDLTGVRLPGPATPTAPTTPIPPITPRRPLHLGPPIPDTSASPVRSLADRGAVGMPARQPGPAVPEYAETAQAPAPAGAWGAPVPGPVTAEAQTAETVVPVPVAEPVGAAQAVVARVATEAGAAAAQVAEAQAPVGQDETYGAPEPSPEHAAADPGQAGAPAPVAHEAQGDAAAADPVGQEPGDGGQAQPVEPAPQDVPVDAVPQGVPAGEPAQVPVGPEGPEGAEHGEVPVPEAVVPEEPQPVAEAVVEAEPEGVVQEAVVVEAPEAASQDTEAPADGELPAPHAAEVPGSTEPAQAVPEAEPAETPEPAPAHASQAMAEAHVPEPAAEAHAPEPIAEAHAPAQALPPHAPAGALAPEPLPAEPEAGVQPGAPEQAEPPADQTAHSEPRTEAPAPQAQAQAPEQPDQAPAAEEAAVQPSEPAPAEQSAQTPEPLAAHAGQPSPETAPQADTAVPAEPAEAVQPLAAAAPAPAMAPIPDQPSAEQQQYLAEPAGPQLRPAAHPDEAVAVMPGAVPQEPAPGQPLGRFVPVEGTVPTTPHLAPTPPQPLILPTEEPQAPAVAEVPAPREADAGLVQHADDLDTRAADEDRADQDAQTEEVPAEAEPRGNGGPAAPGYDDAEREAVLKVMRERRDIRNGFRSDPIPHEVLLRVLEAAHTAPSVGHSQPWDFVVIRSSETRRTMHELAMRQREAYAKSLPKGRAKQFKELKIEAILDTPVNIVVTADPTRGGRHTLGRHTQPQMAPYSAALAVENLWLAARAEGLGVGWVSFFDEREMVRALGLPEHLEVIAYLCVGYVDEFPDEPELLQAGWSKRRPLSWVVHEETYGRRALPGEEPHDLLAETVAQIRPLDAKALGEAWERQKRMTKPAGALGMLEIISAQLSGLSRQCPPPIPEPAAVAIFAGDHGVHAQGVTPWPQEVTAQMVANFLGGGAVCNAFAAQVGAEVCVVDVGVAADLPATPGLLPRKVRAGTADMTTGPAMSREEAKQAIEVGIETARDLVAAGNKALLTGEMGIANTTASAALISLYTGTDPAEVTGRGTGINDETLARKTEVVRRALDFHQPDPADPIGVLAAIGGLEHAALVGLLLGGASLRTPVILDGVSAGAAALVARAIAPEVLAACIAGHRSAEPGHVAALNKLGLRPLVDLDLRLGEGTGALLALPLVQSTARAMHEVATFDSAGVTEK